MITEYVRAYRDCSRYLARWCPPWAWLTGTVAACAELRQAVTAAASSAPGTPGAMPVPAWTERGGTIVPRSAAAPVGMIDWFRFAPGDGHVYAWTPDTEEVRVLRITSTDPWETRDTGDRIDVTGVARTAESMRAAVILWKARKGGVSDD